MKAKNLILPCLFLLLANVDHSRAQIVYEAPRKKLIDFGWHSPFIQEYINNMPAYEKRPFDGVTLKISKEACGGNVFMVDNWEKITNDLKEREMIRASSVKKSTILTDNFMVLYGASQMDWFSDDDWTRVEDQIRYALKLARAANCKGILWDPEPYKPGKNPWKFNEQEKTGQYSFEQFNVQVRKRGAQFMKVLQEEFPGIIIFSLRELSDWQQGSPFSTPLLPVVNRDNTINELKEAWWGLHVAFYAGMIETIQPGTVFIDGNEEAYFYTSELEFYQVRHTMIDDAKALVPPELWTRHSCFNRVGHAIAAEYIAGNWLGMKPFPYRLTGQGLMMTPEERAMWFEHNAYYALRTADEYAWLYTEGMNMWTGEKVADGFLDALIRAKAKVAAGQPLGFGIDQMIKNAQDKAEEFYKNK